MTNQDGWGVSFESHTALNALLDSIDPASAKSGAVAETFAATVALAEGHDAVITATRRVGQDAFREELLRYWGGCAVTEVRHPALLRASHIKPWVDASPTEKTDAFNGLLLCPHLDAAFDAGLISFDHDGGIVISTQLASDDAVRLGITPNLRLRTQSPQHQPYLQHHRNHVFKK